MKPKRSQYDLMHPLFEAMRKAKLKPNQRLVLLGLFRFMNGDGSCYPSYNALIDETGLTRPTIAKTIKELAELNFISFESGSSIKSNHYQLNLNRLGLKGNSSNFESLSKKNEREPVKRIRGRLVTQKEAEAGGYRWIDDITGK